jgi:hypothetical protein
LLLRVRVRGDFLWRFRSQRLYLLSVLIARAPRRRNNEFIACPHEEVYGQNKVGYI